MIFNKPPKILAHKSVITDSNFVTPEYILNKGANQVNLFNRYCPHRMYPLARPGEYIDNIVCKFHGFEWDKSGVPLNNDRNIGCGQAQVGRSGLVFKDFVEPNHYWVDDLAKETNLEFSHIVEGKSTGSWLWMMEIQADLLHIRKGDNVVHPTLAEVTNLDGIGMDQGAGWILQTCSTGWWLFIYPFTFVEYSTGCLSVNYTIPNDADNEFGFSWITQFYYNPSTLSSKRLEFETLSDVFYEDLETIELQKGKYFPLMKTVNRLEDHCVHFGQWVSKNRSV
jgi:nitrite reductase/ring-hydroxylating ferredoxin subunit